MSDIPKQKPSADIGSQTARSLEPEATIKEVADKIGQELVDNLNRNVTAQEIFDEMARRQRRQFHVGPELSWGCVTDEFKTRFVEAYSKKPRTQEAEEFARQFVDQWPAGLGAMRMSPELKGVLARPPYTKDGLWPAFLKTPSKKQNP